MYKEYFTDGSHRFWWDGKPILQIVKYGDKYATVSIKHKTVRNVFTTYPTVFEIAEIQQRLSA